MSEAKVELDLEFSDKVSFVDDGVKYKWKNAEYQVTRPTALQTVKYTKQQKALDKEDIEGQVNFYIEVVTAHGLPKDVSEALDLFSLGEVFRAISTPPVKKK